MLDIARVNAILDNGPVGKGISQSRYFTCDDEQEYIVKFVDSTKTTVNELVCSSLSNYIKLPSPKIALVYISNQLIELSSLSIQEGYHIGFIKLQNAVDFDKFDEKLLDDLKIQNISDFYGVICFDNWVLNGDRCNNGNNLIQIKQDISIYYMIDFGHCFYGNNWNHVSLRHIQNHRELVPIFHFFKKYIISIDKFVVWLNSIKNIDNSLISEITNLIPNAWSNITTQEKEAIHVFLEFRKNILEEIINTNKW